MADNFASSILLPEFSLWEKMKNKRNLISFDLDITARCNHNCRHCYINLPADDISAKSKELNLKGIEHIASQAVDMGALWCLLTGGEPLLREDFFDIYLCLKKKGLLISVFTNASLITKDHIDFFRKYPPRDIEVTVYGVTENTYEQVTRTPGSFSAFQKGLNLLFKNNIKVRLKAMALHSNAHELPQIADYCRQHSKDYFRFDPFLHCRYDRNEERNNEIKAEQLSPEKIVAIEHADAERFNALQAGCEKLINNNFCNIACNHLFHCGTGNGSFSVSYEGYFKPCSSLCHPDCLYDLKTGSLQDAFYDFVSKVRAMQSDDKDFLEKCRKCPIINLCMWCPAHAYLETGKLDKPVEYFCKVAHARAEAIRQNAPLLHTEKNNEIFHRL
jgi:radical SAM protein with 4Fe4S-binding SPASM domain